MKKIFSILVACLFLLSCEKFLDKSPDKQLVIPGSISDLQALLDNTGRMNMTHPGVGEASADDHYVLASDLNAILSSGYDVSYINPYTWEDELFNNVIPNAWSQSYDVIYTSNVVLEEIEKIKRSDYDAPAWDNAKGSAYFYRAYLFWRIIQCWTVGYDAATASGELGIPLRLNSNFNEPSIRSSLQASYDQVIDDAKRSITLLPAQPTHVMRPGRAAAYGLLARAYLSMRDYEKAWRYADSSLQLSSQLLDYKTVDSSRTYPFVRFNRETIFHCGMGAGPTISGTRSKIDSVLMASYASNDLRRALFFRRLSDGNYAFRGTYDGSAIWFTGIATDEMYLIRAECRARAGEKDAALADLNLLLATRWKAGTFVPYTATSASEALEIILQERRKELIMRDLRWSDLKRLNKEGRNIVVRRLLDGVSHVLPPNDPRYALPLPRYVIQLTGMPQNPR